MGGCVSHLTHSLVGGKLSDCYVQATRTQAPPAALILFSAVLEKSLALTITGTLGRVPLPSTLKKPYVKRSMIYKIIIYSFGDIDNSGLVRAGLSLQSCLFWHEWPELVEVDGGRELLVSLQAEVAHTTLSEVPGMAKRKGKGLVFLRPSWERHIGRGWSPWHLCTFVRLQTIKYLLFVHVDSHVVHATSETSTTRMLPVLSNSTVSVWNVSSQLPGLS